MGRIQSGKMVRDTETAAESAILNTLAGSRVKKDSGNSPKTTVTAQMQSDHQFGGFLEKKNRKL